MEAGVFFFLLPTRVNREKEVKKRGTRNNKPPEKREGSETKNRLDQSRKERSRTMLF